MADNSELQEKIRDEFTERIRTDKKLAEIREKIESGGDYSIAEQYAERSGQILSEVLRANITSENFPVGSVEEIAGLIIPSMEKNHGFVSNATAAVQKALNKKGNLGLNAVTPEFDSKSGMHIAGRMAQYESFEDAEWMLDEPMVTDSIGTVDTILHENADFQYRSGLRPKIIRTAEPDCCEWCASLEGEYDYAEVADKGNPVYQRHNNCRCEVTFDPGSGKVQDVWSKAVFDKDSSKDDRVSAIRSKEVQLARREQSKAEARIKKTEATVKAMEVLGYSPKGASIWYNANKADIEKYGLEYMLDYTANASVEKNNFQLSGFDDQPDSELNESAVSKENIIEGDKKVIRMLSTDFKGNIPAQIVFNRRSSCGYYEKITEGLFVIKRTISNTAIPSGKTNVDINDPIIANSIHERVHDIVNQLALKRVGVQDNWIVTADTLIVIEKERSKIIDKAFIECFSEFDDADEIYETIRKEISPRAKTPLELIPEAAVETLGKDTPSKYAQRLYNYIVKEWKNG